MRINWNGELGRGYKKCPRLSLCTNILREFRLFLPLYCRRQSGIIIRVGTKKEAVLRVVQYNSISCLISVYKDVNKWILPLNSEKMPKN